MDKRNDGKAPEEKVREALVALQEKEPVFFFRLYDSTSAQGASIPAQISDFFLTYRGLSISLEVKSSEKHTSLADCPKSYIRKTQVAKSRLLYRAGGSSLYVFHSLADDVFEVWDGLLVGRWVLGQAKLKGSKPILSFKGKKLLQEQLLASLIYMRNK